MKKILFTVIATALLAGLVSCNPETYKKINYLQDVDEDASMSMKINKGIIIQPQDQLSIIVTSRDPKMAVPFNLSVATYYTGTEMGAAGGNQRITGYVVSNDGDIDFPSLGNLHVAGLNRWELQDLIKDKLADSGLLRDAIVTVEFLNFKVSVLGEVTAPGTYTVTGDKITILQALALARDLTIYGQRENVKVIREQNGKRQIYTMNLTNSEIFNSPAYYLQQNDVVYVTPSQVRAGQGEINENYFKSGSFWISLASISMTTINFIIALSNRANKTSNN
ncbi:MAG: polysaccharide biosynthesis/export family protein [Bacteroidales bacterium]|nr:polysaccharide biosynthesis/export family protein [Bacteroidales bacterium]